MRCALTCCAWTCCGADKPLLAAVLYWLNPYTPLLTSATRSAILGCYVSFSLFLTIALAGASHLAFICAVAAVADGHPALQESPQRPAPLWVHEGQVCLVAHISSGHLLFRSWRDSGEWLPWTVRPDTAGASYRWPLRLVCNTAQRAKLCMHSKPWTLAFCLHDAGCMPQATGEHSLS